jgi:hypothetical protein
MHEKARRIRNSLERVRLGAKLLVFGSNSGGFRFAEILELRTTETRLTYVRGGVTPGPALFP